MTQLNEIIDVGSEKEHRRSERRNLTNREMAIFPCAGDDHSHFLRARLTDCSLHGLGLLLPQAVSAGEQVLARVEINRQPTLLMYTIRYCIPTKENEFRAGARFTGFAATKWRGELADVVDSLSGY